MLFKMENLNNKKKKKKCFFERFRDQIQNVELFFIFIYLLYKIYKVWRF